MNDIEDVCDVIREAFGFVVFMDFAFESDETAAGEAEYASWFKAPEPSTAKPALAGLSNVSDMGRRPLWQR